MKTSKLSSNIEVKITVGPNGKVVTMVKGKAGPRKGTLWSSFGGTSDPKPAFLEIPKTENGTKTVRWRQDRHQDPLKTLHGNGFETT